MVEDYTNALHKDNRELFFRTCSSSCIVGPDNRSTVPIYDNDEGQPENDETIHVRYKDAPNSVVWDVVPWYITP